MRNSIQEQWQRERILALKNTLTLLDLILDKKGFEDIRILAEGLKEAISRKLPKDLDVSSTLEIERGIRIHVDELLDEMNDTFEVKSALLRFSYQKSEESDIDIVKAFILAYFDKWFENMDKLTDLRGIELRDSLTHLRNHLEKAKTIQDLHDGFAGWEFPYSMFRNFLKDYY